MKKTPTHTETGNISVWDGTGCVLSGLQPTDWLVCKHDHRDHICFKDFSAFLLFESEIKYEALKIFLFLVISSAVDFTHEALRLLDSEPETAENADRLMDEKAHASLWLYICTLETNLQEVSSFAVYSTDRIYRFYFPKQNVQKDWTILLTPKPLNHNVHTRAGLNTIFWASKLR